jgi:CubicO group peptidase (beta-lactamase class C family)
VREALIGRASARLEAVTAAEIASRLEAAVASDEAPSVVFGAVHADGPAIVRAAGRACLAPPRDAAPDSVYPWFSVTKLFTATAVVQLSEQGRVDLDAPVVTYLPERRLEKNERRATVRHLLSHSAGLRSPNPIPWMHLAGEEGPCLDALTDRLLSQHPGLAFEPGTKCSYSHLGYLLLGQIVERVSGERYRDYVERHLLAPLGCEATGFQWRAAAASGYQRRAGITGLGVRWMLDRRFFGETVGSYWALRPFDVDGAPYGGLSGPMPDLLRFARAVLAGGQAERGRVLRESSVRSMLSPSRSVDGRELQFGLGWQLGSVGGEPHAFHVGGGGFRSEIRLYPGLGYGVAVLANETSFPTDDLLRLVVRIP